MKRLTTLLALAALVGTLGCTKAPSEFTVAMMPKNKGNPYFVSCRKGAEEAAKELGVRLLWDGPTESDPAKQNEIVETWPKDTTIITVCHHGVRSLDAAVYLRQQGFTATRSMRGGIDLWSCTVDPNIPRY